MIKELVEFVTELFPSISPYTKESVMNAIEQFKYENIEWFMPNTLDNLAQGDIIEKLPFSFSDEDGNTSVILTKGIVLSNTCDVENDENIIIAPLFDYRGILDSSQMYIVRSNKYYDKMCFTNSQLDNYFIDFSKATTFNKKLILKLIKLKTDRIYSLNQYGYYLLLTKLTIHFMRPEDKDFNEKRNEEKAVQYA